ncbi:MAG: DNA-binding response regulator [Candidatus Kapaibacterium sp.]|nr:MAG: DNA-binding response regulator [Candidatus Kapabacteria bacterium]
MPKTTSVTNKPSRKKSLRTKASRLNASRTSLRKSIADGSEPSLATAKQSSAKQSSKTSADTKKNEQPLTKRVIICDDHDLVTQLLQTWLTLEKSLQVIKTFNRGEEAILAVKNLQPDILIQDLQLPDLSGVDVIQRIRATGSTIRIYAITGRADLARAAIEAGANGCMLKDESPEELLRALRSDLQGGVWLSPMLAAYFFNANKAISSVKLTNAEIAVLRNLNLTNAEVAEKLLVTEGRVRNIASSIYQKLNVETREAAMHWARTVLKIDYD